MEIDSFPVVASSDVPLENALAILRDVERSAIVIAEDASYSLVTAADIVIARAEQSATRLSGIGDRVTLTAFPFGPVALGVLPYRAFSRIFLDFRDPGLAHRVEQYLEKKNLTFAILGLTSSRALLISRSESDMRLIQASPKDCYCKADHKPVSPGVHRGDCPYDSSHRGTVRCY